MAADVPTADLAADLAEGVMYAQWWRYRAGRRLELDCEAPLFAGLVPTGWGEEPMPMQIHMLEARAPAGGLFYVFHGYARGNSDASRGCESMSTPHPPKP